MIAVFYFVILVFPQPVVELAVLMLNSLSITLMWEYQSNPAQARIESRIEVANESGIIVANLTIEDSSTTTANIGALLPFTMYTLKVYSISSIGTSRATTITVTTLSDGRLIFCHSVDRYFIFCMFSICNNIVLNCDTVILPTQSGRSYAVDETMAVVCLQCGSFNAEWIIQYQNVVYRVTNNFTPNASAVEVIGGVLGVKNPTNQIVRGFYDIDIDCSSSIAYTGIRLYVLSKKLEII